MKKVVSIITLLLFFLAGCSSANATWMDNNDTSLIAHRGAHIVAPENTVESIFQAGKLGYDGVEIDIRTSKDGTNFLMHNNILDKTTNGKGKLENHTDKYLESLKVDTAEYPKYKDEVVRIPTFNKAVEQIKQDNLIVNVDGSKGDWEDEKFVNSIVDTLKEYDVYERSFFVLSDKEIRDQVVKDHPNCIVSWLYDSDDDIDEEIEQVKSYDSALLSISNEDATKAMLDKLNESGIAYQVYNVNDKDRFKELKSLDVPIVETDDINPEDF